MTKKWELDIDIISREGVCLNKDGDKYQLFLSAEDDEEAKMFWIKTVIQILNDE